MTTLWDTTGTHVVRALAAERRTGGAVTSGLALTLVVVTDHQDIEEAEEAAALAASMHPMRMLMVVRQQIDAPVPRLDAEVTIGGRLGPGESVVLRMYGRLALHAESVTLPLLAPDAPVVTWWFGQPPDKIAYDPLGVFAERRITDVLRSEDPSAALQQRAVDFAPGDTDLAWTRLTPWRAALASAFDGRRRHAPTGATVRGGSNEPSARLLAGWLASRLDLDVSVDGTDDEPISGVEIEFANGKTTRATLEGSSLVLRREGQQDSYQPFGERPLGELLAEELRRLDADHIYAAALSEVTGVEGLEERSSTRQHIWWDPATGKEGPQQPEPEEAAS
ncbi:glucose-6-phosphate dehydrogenase assembly protein OpcA [Jatrophihabitans endophyticus]|uniref:Glucose-6-phosphate dehydrogenase assembly protein OpcA n=1 Tax=Jatrophihabitans endophyticus TaxID=1206085 RepID=A0A1M5MZX2_9ACTN|nr:glucose-6-phosphate dehydrogenase assembly protein OpcA [Jatrophihabitans endophyticus]SHG82755.1 glucose-6-phosphate dehydrogenase assembly protein OpcA [Jatrophihabitans endophyticus]